MGAGHTRTWLGLGALALVGALWFFLREGDAPSASRSESTRAPSAPAFTPTRPDTAAPRVRAEGSVLDAGAAADPRSTATPESASDADAATPALEPTPTSPAARASTSDQAPPAPAENPARRRLLAAASERVTRVGLCESEEAQARAKAREDLLRTFTRVDLASGTVWYDPVLPEQALALAHQSLAFAQTESSSLALPGAVVPPAVVIVYRSLNQMRSVSCVNTSAYGYYDGAIHVSGNPNGGLTEIRETLVHEYAHHVMVSQGVRLPTWLSEGAALLTAKESWWREPSLGLNSWIASTHLPFESLVPAFPHASDERSATQAYFQSYLMVEFIRFRAGPTALATLIAALGQGKIGPDEAFAFASGLEGAALEQAWRAWIAGQPVR